MDNKFAGKDIVVQILNSKLIPVNKVTIKIGKIGNNKKSKNKNSKNGKAKKIGSAENDDFILDIFEDEPEIKPPEKLSATETVSMNFYNEDTIEMFKIKIYEATGILPCEQFFIGRIRGYEITVDDIEYTPIFDPEIDEKIDDIPIYRKLYENRDLIKIRNYEYMQCYPFLEAADFAVNLLPLPAVIENYKVVDEGTFELIYWSLVQFYPYFNADALKSYLNKDLSMNYPKLANPKNLTDIDETLYQIYKYLPEADSMFNPGLLLGKTNPNSIIFVSLKRIKVLIYRTDTIDLDSLLKIIRVDKQIPVIKYNKGGVATTILHKKYGRRAFELHKYDLGDNMDTIFLVNSGVVIEINKFGVIYLHVRFQEDKKAQFADLNKAVKSVKSGFIKDLLNNDHRIFSGKSKREKNIIKSIEANILINKSFGADEYSSFIDNMNKKDFVKMTDNGFLWHFGISVDNDDAFIQNDYAYYFDPSYIPKHEELTEGRPVVIVRKSTDLRFSISGFKKHELYSFYRYMITQLGNIKMSKEDIRSMKDIIEGRQKVNNLKMLRFKDPNAFNLKQYGSDVVYARLCQKNRQPLPLDKSDTKHVKDKDRMIKFINYSTGDDIYYYCPHNKYKYPSFIVGYHPKNYCMVCCNKVKASHTKKKAQILNTCLDKHEYKIKKEKTKATRYINNYGKDIEVNRLSVLPDKFNKFLVYNVETSEILSEYRTQRTFIFKEKVYSIDRLFKITKRSKVYRLDSKLFEPFLYIPIWSNKRKGVADIRPIDVIENPQLNRRYRKHYERIVNANMSFPILVYKSREGLMVIDGIHRICKTYMENIKKIDVRKVTRKQLDRARIGVAEDVPFKVQKGINPPIKIDMVNKKNLAKLIKGGTFTSKENKERMPFYYILGVEQYVNNQLCGMIGTLAMAFDMSISNYIEYVIQELSDSSTSIKGYDREELINLIGSYFQQDIPLEKRDDWNDIFMQICFLVHDIVPIMVEDISQNRAGTNISGDEDSMINIILPYKVKSLGAFGDKKYLLIFRRTVYSNIGQEILYYPIFIFIPYSYFKRGEIERRLFDLDDVVIKLLDQIVKTHLVSKDVTIDLLREIAEVVGVYIDNIGMVYACELKWKNTNLFMSVDKTAYDGKTEVMEFTGKSKYPAKKMVQFIVEYNKKFARHLEIEKIYYRKGALAAIKIGDYISFANGKTADLKGAPAAKNFGIEELLYPVEKIFTAVKRYGKSKDPILKIYNEHINNIDGYLKYKQNIFDIFYKEKNTAERNKITNMFKKDPIAAKTYIKSNHPDFQEIIRDLPDLESIYSFDKITLNKLVNASESEIKKIITSLSKGADPKFIKALTTEFADPVKAELLYNFKYNFEDQPIRFRENEVVYVKSV